MTSALPTRIFAGGDSVPVALQERVRQVMGVGMVEGLAQTETGPSIVNPLAGPRLGSLVWSIEASKRASSMEQAMPFRKGAGRAADSQPGTLLRLLAESRSDRRGRARRLVLHRRSVSRDADGYYWFRGRLKEIIVRGGSNISPQEVEEALYTHRSFSKRGSLACRTKSGRTVVAVVTLRDGATCGEEDIRAHASRTLADYKVPERVHFLPALPKSATGKVHRRALKDALIQTARRAAT